VNLRLTKFLTSAAAVFVSALMLAACSSTDLAAKLTRELLSMPKEEAYARGEALVAKRKYETGRQYLRFVAENYANDPIGKQAALRLADSYFDEKTPLGYLEAQARYKDFRNRYPSHPKADYALFRLAQCADRQAETPDRDQANTRLAAISYRDVLQNFPDSPYTAEARARYTSMRSLLASHEHKVAAFYVKRRAYVAAKGRFDTLLGAFPEYTELDQVLYLAGVVERKLGHEADSRLLWERLSRDYPASPLVKKLKITTAPTATTAVR
jgi:outer membrane protein assembly factor BamD